MPGKYQIYLLDYLPVTTGWSFDISLDGGKRCSPEEGKRNWLSISFISFQKDYLCGEVSTNILKKIIDEKKVMCKYISKDRYKRYVAECFKGEKNINAFMVRNGYAVAYRKYSLKYTSHENIAKKEKLGLWAGSFDMPWDWRKNR